MIRGSRTTATTAWSKDELGKIDLNAADETLLTRLFTSVGLDAQAASSLVEKILDWRSPADLKGLNGADFDKAYIENEVTYHETVIKAVDDTLIPNAKNAELKALLESGKPIFVSHLNHAKELQASLK